MYYLAMLRNDDFNQKTLSWIGMLCKAILCCQGRWPEVVLRALNFNRGNEIVRESLGSFPMLEDHKQQY